MQSAKVRCNVVCPRNFHCSESSEVCLGGTEDIQRGGNYKSQS